MGRGDRQIDKTDKQSDRQTDRQTDRHTHSPQNNPPVATAFRISLSDCSGYVRASLVFVLMLSLRGSAAGPRSVGMALATLAVSAHFYRAYVRGRCVPVVARPVEASLLRGYGARDFTDACMPGVPTRTVSPH